MALGPGCKREKIEVYWTPKEPRVAAQSPSEAAPALPGLTWTTPGGWAEEPPGQMQVANFTIAGSNHQATVSIIPLAGMDATDLQIANLYRSTLQLPPLSAAELPAASVPVTIGGERGQLFDLASEAPLIDDKFRARLLVAALNKGDVAWFIKMAGEDRLVAGQKPIFLEFLQSLRFAERPVETTPAAGSQTLSTNAKRTPRAPATPIWDVPSHWRAQQPSPMRLASFLVEKPAGKAEVSVTVFGQGEGGDVLANVNRWRGQLGLPAADQSALKNLTGNLSPAMPGSLLVDLPGAANGKKENQQRILAAIVPRADHTWFYKMMGDEAIVLEQRDAFLNFVKSVKYADLP